MGNEHLRPAFGDLEVSRREFLAWSFLTSAIVASTIVSGREISGGIHGVVRDIAEARRVLETDYQVLASPYPLAPPELVGARGINSPFVWAFDNGVQDRCFDQFKEYGVNTVRVIADLWYMPFESEIGKYNESIINRHVAFCERALNQGINIIDSPGDGWRLLKCLWNDPVYGKKEKALHPLTRKYGYDRIFIDDQVFELYLRSFFQIADKLVELQGKFRGGPQIFINFGNELIPPRVPEGRRTFNQRLQQFLDAGKERYNNRLPVISGVDDPGLVNHHVAENLAAGSAHYYFLGRIANNSIPKVYVKHPQYPVGTIIEEAGFSSRLAGFIPLPQDFCLSNYLLYLLSNNSVIDHERKTITPLTNSLLLWKLRDPKHDDGYGFSYDWKKYPRTMAVLERLDQIFHEADRLKLQAAA